MTKKIEKFNFNAFNPASEKNGGKNIACPSDFKPGLGNALRIKENAGNVPRESNTNTQSEKEDEKNKYTEDDLNKSRTKGYEEGYAKGYGDAKSASDDINRKIDASLKIIDEKITQMIQMNRVADLRSSKELAEISVRMAKKIAADALQANPVSEIEKIVQKSFGLFFDEPKLAIYINTSLVPEISRKVDLLSGKENFKGEVEIYGRDDIAEGSCSIEWQGGGLKSDKEDMLNEIEKMCAKLH